MTDDVHPEAGHPKGKRAMPTTKPKRSASKPKAAQAPSKTGKAEPVERATHGFVSSADEGGVKREIHILRLNNGRYTFRIQTLWPDSAKPVSTAFSLSEVGFALLSGAVVEATFNMARWRIPVSSDPSQDSGRERAVNTSTVK